MRCSCSPRPPGAILLAYDGGDAAHDALVTAAQLARVTGAEVGVISVATRVSMLGAKGVEPWDNEAVHGQQLAEAELLLGVRGIEPELLNKTGDPAEIIEEVADLGGYDTIVVGRPAHGRTVARLPGGSVAWHVAEHAR